MDNLTHTLTAVALSQAGLNRKTRFATLALVIGVNLPDADLVATLGGGATYLKYHRGITHSLLGVTVLAAALAPVIYGLGRRVAPKKSGPPLNRGWLLAACWIATASHLLLDFTNAYGVRPFLPFSGRWYAWDIMFILDPLLWALLAAGLGVPMILRLVSEEVGARKSGYQRGAIFALVCLALLWGVRSFAHARAVGMLDAHTYGGENPIRVGAFPSPVNPFDWNGVVETDSGFYRVEVNVLAENVNPRFARFYRTAEPSPPLEAATQTRTAKIFLDFARFPWAEVEPEEGGFAVVIRDLRFLSTTSTRSGFVTEIELDKDLRVRSESFSFQGIQR